MGMRQMVANKRRNSKQGVSSRRTRRDTRRRGLNIETLEGRLALAGNILSGFVYLDGNGNGARDSGEVGVPGAMITLTRSGASAGVVQTAVTASDGSYSFSNLPAGTYSLIERQPSALVDGLDSSPVAGAVVGNDQISNLVISGDQTFANNNFGEARVLGSYINIGWFFASSVADGSSFRQAVALGEQAMGDGELAEVIRDPAAAATPSAGTAVPTAAADSYQTDAGETLVVATADGVLKNDSDANSGDSLTAVLVGTPAHGTLTLNLNGGFTYKPNAGYTGSDNFRYAASDGVNYSAAVEVSLLVVGANGAPTAANDSYSVDQDATLTIAAPGLLTNDVDPEGNTLTAQVVSTTTHGTLTLQPNGSFVYVPTAGYAGPDSFTYRVVDQSNTSNTATVSLTVRAKPVATADTYAAVQDTPLTVAAATGVLANDSNAAGGTLTASLVTGPTSGQLTLNPNGSFTYTPNSGFAGADSFTYKAQNGTLSSATVTVTLNVERTNSAPTVANNTYVADEDTALVVPVATGVLNNDSDADGDTLTATLATGPAHGTLTLNSNGSFTYTPAANYFGADTFVYRANDGRTSTPATVTLTINEINDPPVANDDRYVVEPGATLTIAAPGLLANDTDIDPNPVLTTTIDLPASHGTAFVNSDGSFTYTPTAGYRGTDSFQYQLSDIPPGSDCTIICTADGTEIGTDGLVHTDRGVVTIDVNSKPVLTADNYETAEDTTLTVNATTGVLANDSDADSNPMTASIVAQAAHGIVTLNANGSFSYVPTANYSGPDSFTYKVNDGFHTTAAQTVTLTVTAVNDAPVGTADSYSIAGAGPLVVNAATGVLANDTDAEGSTLTAALITGPSHGTLTLNSDGSFSYTPTGGFHGTDTFVYQARDASASSPNVQVSISVNAAPTAVNDSYAINEDSSLTVGAATGVLANDTDGDGDSLTAAVVSNPTHGTLTLNANGGFTYTPTANYNGADSFTYRANDGNANSAIATVAITVNPVNDAPTAANDSYVATEDQTLTVAVGTGVLANDADVDTGTTLTASVVANPSHGTLTLNSNGSFTYVPAANYQGADSFRYRVSDGQANSAEATVSLTVTSTNDAPQGTADSFTTNQNTLLTVAVANGVLKNDTDADGDTLTAVVVSSPAHGTLTLNSNGSFTYNPAQNFSGTDTFTYAANDGKVNSAAVTASIQVAASNTFVVSQSSTKGQVVGTVTPTGTVGTNRVYDLVSATLPTDLQILPDDHMVGNPAARAVLIEYLDIQCPPCAFYHPTVRGMEQQFPNDLLVIRRHLPLTTIHPNALEAAQASEAAARQGKFDEFVNTLYTNQSAWSSLADPTAAFESYAQAVGVNLTQYRTDLADPAIAARVQRDMDAAQRLGLNATPSFFLNGVKVASPPSTLAGFSALVQSTLDASNPTFELDRSTGQLRVFNPAGLNAQTNPTQTLNVRIRDTNGVNQTVTVTINVTAGSGEGEGEGLDDFFLPAANDASLNDWALSGDDDWLAND